MKGFTRKAITHIIEGRAGGRCISSFLRSFALCSKCSLDYRHMKAGPMLDDVWMAMHAHASACLRLEALLELYSSLCIAAPHGSVVFPSHKVLQDSVRSSE